jgi:NTP pyrophosphatase (non-canonical NTP hydrolase)
MNFNEYQKQALLTELMERPQKVNANDPSFVAKVLGLAGEAGEVSDKIKKIIRDQNGIIGVNNKIELEKELGDVLWYVAIISDYLGINLDKVATTNIEKLKSRKERGASRGSGDNR